MILSNKEVRHLGNLILGRKLEGRGEKAVFKKIIHAINHEKFPWEELEEILPLTRSECKVLYSKMLANEFINRDFYEELVAIIRKIEEFSNG